MYNVKKVHLLIFENMCCCLVTRYVFSNAILQLMLNYNIFDCQNLVRWIEEQNFRLICIYLTNMNSC